MEKDRALWPDWAGFLKRWGLTRIALTLLDGARPLAVLFSQMLYMGQVFFAAVSTHGHVKALASVLEEDDTARAFADFLRRDAGGI